MSSEMKLPENSPVIIAWENYKKTEEFENSKKWCASTEHINGSLWAIFSKGFWDGIVHIRQWDSENSTEGDLPSNSDLSKVVGDFHTAFQRTQESQLAKVGKFECAIQGANQSQSLLSDEEIIEIADRTKTAESRDGDYILPISFAREIEKAVKSKL